MKFERRYIFSRQVTCGSGSGGGGGRNVDVACTNACTNTCTESMGGMYTEYAYTTVEHLNRHRSLPDSSTR